MAFFDKYKPMISKKVVGGEVYLNLYEIVKFIELHKMLPEIEEAIIIPYYINEKGRYELYQYEFCIQQENGETFEEYLFRVTGKNKFEEIPDSIIKVRKMCFARRDKEDSDIVKKLYDYFCFLLNDISVQNEIKSIFSEFDSKKLYICIY